MFICIKVFDRVVGASDRSSGECWDCDVRDHRVNNYSNFKIYKSIDRMIFDIRANVDRQRALDPRRPLG